MTTCGRVRVGVGVCVCVWLCVGVGVVRASGRDASGMHVYMAVVERASQHDVLVLDCCWCVHACIGRPLSLWRGDHHPPEHALL